MTDKRCRNGDGMTTIARYIARFRTEAPRPRDERCGAKEEDFWWIRSREERRQQRAALPWEEQLQAATEANSSTGAVCGDASDEEARDINEYDGESKRIGGEKETSPLLDGHGADSASIVSSKASSSSSSSSSCSWVAPSPLSLASSHSSMAEPLSSRKNGTQKPMQLHASWALDESDSDVEADDLAAGFGGQYDDDGGVEDPEVVIQRVRRRLGLGWNGLALATTEERGEADEDDGEALIGTVEPMPPVSGDSSTLVGAPIPAASEPGTSVASESAQQPSPDKESHASLGIKSSNSVVSEGDTKANEEVLDTQSTSGSALSPTTVECATINEDEGVEDSATESERRASVSIATDGTARVAASAALDHEVTATDDEASEAVEEPKMPESDQNEHTLDVPKERDGNHRLEFELKLPLLPAASPVVPSHSRQSSENPMDELTSQQSLGTDAIDEVTVETEHTLQSLLSLVVQSWSSDPGAEDDNSVVEQVARRETNELHPELTSVKSSAKVANRKDDSTLPVACEVDTSQDEAWSPPVNEVANDTDEDKAVHVWDASDEVTQLLLNRLAHLEEALRRLSRDN